MAGSVVRCAATEGVGRRTVSRGVVATAFTVCQVGTDRIRSTAWSDGVREGSEPEENFTQTASVTAAGVTSK